MRVTYINSVSSKKISKKNYNYANKVSKNSRVNNKKSTSGLFGYSVNSVLQFLSLVVIACFGILLIPNLLTQDTPKATAQEPKRVQIVSNFATTTTNSSSTAGQLVDVESFNIPDSDSSSSSSSTKIIANPNFAASTKTYKVAKNDTLASISFKLNIDPVELAIINGLKNSKVEVGVELKLP